MIPFAEKFRNGPKSLRQQILRPAAPAGGHDFVTSPFPFSCSRLRKNNDFRRALEEACDPLGGFLLFESTSGELT